MSSIYMIQNNHADWDDHAREGDTIDTMDEDYGYFTTREAAQAYADNLLAEGDRTDQAEYSRRQKAIQDVWEKDKKEHAVLVKAGLRTPHSTHTYKALEWVRPWSATTYTVLEIKPA